MTTGRRKMRKDVGWRSSRQKQDEEWRRSKLEKSRRLAEEEVNT
jgi:hypothetical protein